MLDATKYSDIDQVFPYFGEMVETCCGDFTFAPATEVCTSYGNLVNHIYRCFQCPSWNQVELL